MSTQGWPRPSIDPWNRVFWEAAAQHRLVLQRCASCGRLRHPPGPSCRACLSSDFDWQEASGTGSVESWVIFHQCYFEELAARIPYNVVLVRLSEDVPFIGNVVGPSSEISIGLPVRVVFDDVDDTFSVPRFAVDDGARRSLTPAGRN